MLSRLGVSIVEGWACVNGFKDMLRAAALIGTVFSIAAALTRHKTVAVDAAEKAKTKRALVRIEKKLGAINAKL